MRKRLISIAVAATLLTGSIAFSTAFSTDPIGQLEARAENGDVTAQMETGKAFLDADGVPRDVERGIYWLERAAAGNEPNANLLLARHYEGLAPTAEHRERMVQYYRRAAVLGHTDAQTTLGRMLLHSTTDARLSAEKQAEARQKGLQMLDHAARAGNAEAAFELATAWTNGRAGARDHDRSTRYFEMAATAGHGQAAFVLAGQYLADPTAATYQPATGIRWLRRAAESEIPPAMADLADRYARGEGVPKNLEQARHWAERAATLGDQQGRILLARLPKPAPAAPPATVATAAPASAAPATAAPATAAPAAPASVAKTMPIAPEPARVETVALAAAPSAPATTDRPAATPASRAGGLSFASGSGSSPMPAAAGADFEALLGRIGELQARVDAYEREVTDLREQVVQRDRVIATVTAERDRAFALVEGIERSIADLRGVGRTRVEHIAQAPAPAPRTDSAKPAKQAAPNVNDLTDEGLAAMRRNDYETARRAFEKAAAAGHHIAMNNLAMLYMRGQGVPLSMDKAIGHFTDAAERGNAVAANNLGYIYQHGLGVSPNREKAIQWYRKGAEAGSDLAREQLRELGVAPALAAAN